MLCRMVRMLCPVRRRRREHVLVDFLIQLSPGLKVPLVPLSSPVARAILNVSAAAFPVRLAVLLRVVALSNDVQARAPV